MKNYLKMLKKTKSKAEKFIQYINILSEDTRLNVWHLAILVAILQLGYKQRQKRLISVSRSRIMSLSHVQTLPTYHKYFNELQNFGYIMYTPSYHPGYRSVVKLTIKARKAGF
ncbi:hypothetical protein AP058_01654 [Flavobacterium sp. TAB 87]|nr:hypothetical protein AP058_01654 [Flavobacterium sp. TAB 87]